MSFTERDVETAARAIWTVTGHRESDWVYMPPEDERRQKYMACGRAALRATVPGILAAPAHEAKVLRGERKTLAKNLDSWESQGHGTVTIRFLRGWLDHKEAR